MGINGRIMVRQKSSGYKVVATGCQAVQRPSRHGLREWVVKPPAPLSTPCERLDNCLRALVALHQNGPHLNGSFTSRKTAMITRRTLSALIANRSQFLRLAAGAVAFSIVFACGQDAASQTNKTIRLIVP